MTDLATAQHEAAHVVIGVALGLRLIEASVQPVRVGAWVELGRAWFDGGERRHREAWALMYAAGVAWERLVGGDAESGDLAELRRMRVTRAGVDALARAAGAMLRDLAPAHARVTRALVEHGAIRARDVERLARGERLGGED